MWAFSDYTEIHINIVCRIFFETWFKLKCHLKKCQLCPISNKLKSLPLHSFESHHSYSSQKTLWSSLYLPRSGLPFEIHQHPSCLSPGSLPFRAHEAGPPSAWVWLGHSSRAELGLSLKSPLTFLCTGWFDWGFLSRHCLFLSVHGELHKGCVVLSKPLNLSVYQFPYL